jgi:hypothetical protein
MSTKGIPRMSNLKSVLDVPETYFGMCATSKWIEGCFPNMDAAKLLIVRDSEFVYTGRVALRFDHTNTRELRKELRQCFVDRWFSRSGAYPCSVTVYEHGDMVYKVNFILQRHGTARGPRNDFRFSFPPQEWYKLYLAHKCNNFNPPFAVSVAAAA